MRRRLQLLARALKLALTPLTLTLTLTLTLSLTRCAADCSFSPEQLEAVISATFASAELDSDGRIRRHSLKPLYREAAIGQPAIASIGQPAIACLYGSIRLCLYPQAQLRPAAQLAPRPDSGAPAAAEHQREPDHR